MDFRTLKNTKIYLSLFWKFLNGLGGVSLLVSVITFWIIQYNNYIQIGNSIRADTSINIAKLQTINDDTTKTWGYTFLLSDNAYNNNWNFILQYYSTSCIQSIEYATINIESINTLISQRQIGNTNLDQGRLYDIGVILMPQLEKIAFCPIEPWHSKIINNFIILDKIYPTSAK